MLERMEGERMLMRIFLGEADRCPSGPYRGRPTWEAVLLTLRERGLAGATVLRGIAGFGATARIHTTQVLRLSMDLPIVVEAVDEERRIRSVLEELDDLIQGGLVTLERAEVLIYRPSGSS